MYVSTKGWDLQPSVLGLGGVVGIEKSRLKWRSTSKGPCHHTVVWNDYLLFIFYFYILLKVY